MLEMPCFISGVATLPFENGMPKSCLVHRSYIYRCERRLLFAYMESSIRTYPGLSKTLYLACKTRQEHPENEVGKNVTGLENEVGTPRQLRYVTNMVRSSCVPENIWGKLASIFSVVAKSFTLDPKYDCDWKNMRLPSGNLTQLLKMAIEIVDFPIKNGGSFHSYVKLPEGKS